MGGIGIFFPGTTGFATEENSPLNTPLLSNGKKPDLTQIAEYMAFVAAGEARQPAFRLHGPVNGAPALPGFTEPFRPDRPGRHHAQPFRQRRPGGAQPRAHSWAKTRRGQSQRRHEHSGRYRRRHAAPGQGVPYGWLVTPHDGTGLTAADVEAIVARGIAEADQVRAQIRLPFNSTAKMVFAVSDENGNILGLYRMPDATYFSIGVAVAKARNVAYYDNAAQLQPIDQIKGVAAGTAFTARTFRYRFLAVLPRGHRHQPTGPGLDPHRRRRDEIWNEQGSALAGQCVPEHPGL